jgi:hypothetical protein
VAGCEAREQDGKISVSSRLPAHRVVVGCWPWLCHRLKVLYMASIVVNKMSNTYIGTCTLSCSKQNTVGKAIPERGFQILKSDIIMTFCVSTRTHKMSDSDV